MAKYKLESTQTVTTNRTYLIEADSREEAEAKFMTLTHADAESDLEDVNEGIEGVTNVEEAGDEE